MQYGGSEELGWSSSGTRSPKQCTPLPARHCSRGAEPQESEALSLPGAEFGRQLETRLLVVTSDICGVSVAYSQSAPLANGDTARTSRVKSKGWFVSLR